MLPFDRAWYPTGWRHALVMEEIDGMRWYVCPGCGEREGPEAPTRHNGWPHYKDMQTPCRAATRYELRGPLILEVNRAGDVLHVETIHDMRRRASILRAAGF